MLNDTLCLVAVILSNLVGPGKIQALATLQPERDTYAIYGCKQRFQPFYLPQEHNACVTQNYIEMN
jgi:hypothetical protein